MLISTGTLSVNAAFLREIKDDNRELRELLDRAERLLASPPTSLSTSHDSPKIVAETLARLRDQLATHFALEEAYGYFQDALDVSPRLENKATALRNQHCTLFVEICNVVDAAERVVYHEISRAGFSRVMESFRQFHRRLQKHEADENELILQAFDDELGAGD